MSKKRWVCPNCGKEATLADHAELLRGMIYDVSLLKLPPIDKTENLPENIPRVYYD